MSVERSTIAAAQSHSVWLPSATDMVIERTVVELNRLGRAATLNFTMEVGSLIIHNLYDGDFRAWRHRGAKCSSFRQLAKHPSLPMSAGSLYRCVAIYEVCERLGASSWTHVSTSHLRLVLPLPSMEQERLVRSAEIGRWPVRRLRDEITAMRDPDHCTVRRKGGRRRQSPTRRISRLLENCLEACARIGTVEDEPSPESARLVVDAVERMHRMCAHLQQRFAAPTKERNCR